MPEVDEAVGELLLGDLLDAVGRRAVVDHLGLGPGVRVLRVADARNVSRSPASWSPPPDERPPSRAGRRRSASGKRCSRSSGILAVAVFGDRLAEQLAEPLLRSGQIDPVLRPLRPGDARADVARSSSRHVE